MDGSTFSNSEIEALSAPTVVKPKKAFAIAFAVFATVLAGCATGLGANTYDRASVGQVARVEEGQVVAVRNVQTEGSQQGYTVRLRSGELVSIVQRGDYAIANGTPVLVEYGQRARVIPQNASIGY